MSESPSYKIIQGNCIDVMRTMPDECVNTCVTSPPWFSSWSYGLGSAEKKLEDYIDSLVEVFSQVRRILRNDGTLWLNIMDNTRMVTRGIPWKLALRLMSDGWYLRQEMIWSKTNYNSLKFENIRGDVLPTSHEYIFLMSKSLKYYFDCDSIKNIHKMSVWSIPGYQDYQVGGVPFTPAPKEIVNPCVLAGCPVGGVVFDPCVGYGTTAIVALENGRNFVGCELNPDYIKIAENRIAKEVPNITKGLTE